MLFIYSARNESMNSKIINYIVEWIEMLREEIN